MRLLWARVGVPYSPATGLPIESQTVSQMVDRVMALPEGTRLYLLAPVVRGRKGEYRKELAEFLKKGYQRVKIDGTFYEIAEAPALDKKFKHDIDVVVDRLVVRPDIAHAARGLARAGAQARRGPGRRRARRHAPRRGAKANKRPQRERRAPDLLREIRLPGVRLHHRRDRAAAVLVQQPVRRLPGLRRARRRAAHRRRPGHPRQGRDPAQGRDRAVGAARRSPYYMQTLDALGKHYSFTLDTTWKDLPKKTQDAILYGSGDDDIKFTYDDGMRALRDQEAVRGRDHQSRAPLQGDRERLGARGAAEILHRHPLRACNGSRLKPEALCVKIAGKHIGEVSELSVKRAGEWFTELPEAAQRQAERDRRPRAQGDPRAAASSWSMSASNISRSRAPPARCRAARASASASPRRSARASPACSTCSTSPRSACTSATTRGCSKRCKRLRDLGNTVIVVEHDEDAIRTADYVLDIGPGAGIHGGEIVAAGHRSTT